MNNRNVVGVIVLVLTGLVWAWTLGWFSGKRYSNDPQVAELEKLVAEKAPKMSQLSGDERRAGREDFRKRMQGLSPEQRQAVMEGIMPVMVPMFARQFEAKYDEFMKKSPDEQRKDLDKEIDRMEAAAKRSGNSNVPTGGMRNMDPKKVEQFRKKMLDWTTPEQRAKFENGLRMFNDRRAQRGLTPVNPPGRSGLF